MANLTKMIQHPSVTAQNARIMLITPPPVDEYGLAENDLVKTVAKKLQRTAEHTKQYAEACRQVGEKQDVVVMDLWSAFMTEAGYVAGQPLPGDRTLPRNEKLQQYFHDGMDRRNDVLATITNRAGRPALQPRSL